ncbi:MAG: type I secretion system permease/ATPase, partial [Rhodobacteraceae bacterium]|nr:type I secretion system permease/ATPase [Paracoccaceae bacterium]
MLAVYDIVLPAADAGALVALSCGLALLYACHALLDHARGAVLARLGAAFQARCDARVLAAHLRAEAAHPARAGVLPGPAEVQLVQRTLASPVTAAVLDLPWTPLFVAALWILHPQLGALALAGCALVAGLAAAQELVTRAALAHATATEARAAAWRTALPAGWGSAG